MTTHPANEQEHEDVADHLVLIDHYEAPDGSVYAHKDFVRVVEPWAVEKHISPASGTEAFGDVQSFASYTKRHSTGGEDGKPITFATWNSKGFKAVLDYHDGGEAGRTQWVATYPFVATPQWTAWRNLATGQGVDHQKAVEFLDDRAPEIVEPDAASLLSLLRSLRGNVNTGASAELRPDGTTHVTFDKNTRVTAGANEIDLPPEFTIGIPILKGDDQPWKLVVKLRVTIDSNSRLQLRFTLPQAEIVLETVYAERVAKAVELLGDDIPLLRAAD